MIGAGQVGSNRTTDTAGSKVQVGKRSMQRRCYFMTTSWSDSPVSTHIRALADELARRGHTVVLLVDKQNHQVENHDGNPAVYTWPSVRPTRFRDALFLRRLIKQYRPDFVMGAFGAKNLMICIGWWMRVPCRAAWYLTLAKQIEIDGQIARWKLKLLQVRKRAVYRLATHVVANSVAGSEDVQNVYGVVVEKCHVLYLSLPDPKLQLPDYPTNVAQDRTICVGRLHAGKGQDVLLKAIVQLKDRFPDTVFEFVGDGPCRAEYEKLAADLGIADRCRFVGRLSLDEVLRRMGASLISVVPSRSECFGLVNIESMAMGTPVIASNVGGIGEIFDDGVEGFLVPPDDPASLADRIARLLGDPALRDEMSRKALQRFQKFERGKVISSQVDWFESLVSHSDIKQPATEPI